MLSPSGGSVKSKAARGGRRWYGSLRKIKELPVTRSGSVGTASGGTWWLQERQRGLWMQEPASLCCGHAGVAVDTQETWLSSVILSKAVDYGASCFGEKVQEPSWKAKGTSTSEHHKDPRAAPDPSSWIAQGSPGTGRTSNATQVLPIVPGIKEERGRAGLSATCFDGWQEPPWLLTPSSPAGEARCDSKK